MIRIRLEPRDSNVVFGGDDKPEEQKVFQLRVVWITCPCVQTLQFYLTTGDHFTLPTGTNVWNYSLNGTRITISPSIGLNAVAGHTPECHMVITDQEFEWVAAGPSAA